MPDWAIISIGLAVFATISLWTITKFSIWFDEAFGAYLIKFNFFDVARYTATDVHPPLYYWLLKIWCMLFGNTELALRSMSVFFGGVAIIFGYLLVRRLFSKQAAAISLLFMVLSPMFIRYSQEARMYTLVAAIALAATYVLTYAVMSKKKAPWIIYGVLISLGMWTHYFAAIIWLAHWVWRAGAIKKVAPKVQFVKMFFSRQWIMAHAVAIGLFLPWLPVAAVQMTVVQAFGFWIPAVTPNTLINFMTNVIYYLDVTKVTGWLTLAFIALIIFAARMSYLVYKKFDGVKRESYKMIMVLAFVPMLILFMLSMPPLRSSFIDRYLIGSTVGIMIFMGITVAYSFELIKSKFRIPLVIFVVALLSVGISNVYDLGNFNKNSSTSNNTRQVVESVTKNISAKGQPIIAATPWLFYEVVFYETNDNPVYFINAKEYKYGSLDMVKLNDQHKIKDLDNFLKNNKTFWYIGWSNEGKIDPPEDNLEKVQEILVNDSVSGKPAYKAIQFRVIPKTL